MMAGNHVPQIIKLWKTKDAQAFSGLSLFFQLGGSLLFFVFAASSGSAVQAMFGVWNFLCVSLYLWFYVQHPKAADPWMQPMTVRNDGAGPDDETCAYSIDDNL